ncbi:MAG: Histone H2A.Z-specific chaperone [Trizodia sp. TS-e1964]|nr:MAG: Histone H2A.Z-specific chaperone [Trizodia sp. TS-e1964]
MADHHNGVAAASHDQAMDLSEPAVDKGKGRALDHEPMSTGGEEESSSDEELDETHDLVEEEDEDNMEEISEENIIADGRRTRGKQINFVEAAETADDLEEDEENDADYKVQEVDEDSHMQG